MDQYKSIGEKVSESLNKINPDTGLTIAQERSIKSRKTMSEKTKEERSAINEKISKGLKKYYKSLTKKERSMLYNTVKKGMNHPNSRPIGSFYVQKHGGYKMVKVSDNKWKAEHVLVVEKYIGRKLRKGETIHHIDENRINNDPNNLYLFSKRGLHSAFTQLVKHGIIKLDILKSNLEQTKLTGLYE